MQEAHIEIVLSNPPMTAFTSKLRPGLLSLPLKDKIYHMVDPLDNLHACRKGLAHLIAGKFIDKACTPFDIRK